MIDSMIRYDKRLRVTLERELGAAARGNLWLIDSFDPDWSWGVILMCNDIGSPYPMQYNVTEIKRNLLNIYSPQNMTIIS